MSNLFVRTLREAPSDVGSPGYSFLLRSAFLRPLPLGNVCLLPLGVRVERKLKQLTGEAFEAMGGQEIVLPSVLPAELVSSEEPWQDEQGLYFKDHARHDLVLGANHVKAFLSVAGNVIQSYRQLPSLLYQFWRSYREVPLDGGGLFGAHEELRMDAFSLHSNESDLGTGYVRAQHALAHVFDQCGLAIENVVSCLDKGGSATGHRMVWMGGSGDQRVVRCQSCGYLVDQSIAAFDKGPSVQEDLRVMEDVATPDCKTIVDLAAFLGIQAAQTAKSLFLVAWSEDKGDFPVIAVVRGDMDLNEYKLKKVLGATTVGPATEAEIRAMGAEPGYGSPLGLDGVTVVVDDSIPLSPNLVAGANRPGYHTLNVNYGRDFNAAELADIALAGDGYPCGQCGGTLELIQGTELARLENFGDGDTQAIGVNYMDQKGQAHTALMGRYSVFIDRVFAVVAESRYDENGIVWPSRLAPFQVHLMTVGKRDESVDLAAERLYAELEEAGIEVLYDDRDERAGVKFYDADLIGVPLRVVVGDRGLGRGVVETKRRRGGDTEPVPVDDLLPYVMELLKNQD